MNGENIRIDCDAGRDHRQRMKVVGLTGGICGGKSTICATLRRAGAATIDCDSLGHDVYAPGTPAHAQVVATFGRGVLAAPAEGAAGAQDDAATPIDRRALGARVFGDAAALARLNAIVWPAVRAAVEAQLAALAAAPDAPRAVFVEAALLLEAGFDKDVCTDGVWVAVVPPDVACRRLCARNGLTEEQARARIAAQRPVADYLRCATRAFHTDRPQEEVAAEVLSAYDDLLKP